VSSIVALLSALGLSLQATLQLYQSRRSLGPGPVPPGLDALCVLATTTTCNALLGTAVLPLGWATLVGTPWVPLGVEVLYFVAAGPLLTACLFRVANME
jgi:hypothetical protein